MKLIIVSVIALVVSAKNKEDARLKQVDKVFVTGNSRSANEVRNTLSELRARTRWKNICISGATNKEDADAVLEIAEAVPLGEWKDGTTRLPQSSATLTLKTGDVIWSNDSQFSSVFILKRLNEAVCRTKSVK